MSSINLKTLLICLCILLTLFFCWSPISTDLLGIATADFLMTFFSNYEFHMLLGERCDCNWVKFNSMDLETNFKLNLYGQHLVNLIVPKAIKAHTSMKNPKKALVMAFHGWTGSGKNHVSKMIVESLYRKGAKSNFVHWYIATHDFPHAGDNKNYHDRLQREISEFTKNCGRSLFIFDEIDKMSPGVIDALTPFLDFYEQVDGIDYRKNIFLFLSNAGGSEITRIAYNFWLDGKDREDIAMRDIEPLVNLGAFNEKGGFHHSKIIEKNLIDVYIPFLPLEKSHIEECIAKELSERRQSVDSKVVMEVANQLLYHPKEFELFSTSGCKRIAHKIDIYGME